MTVPYNFVLTTVSSTKVHTFAHKNQLGKKISPIEATVQLRVFAPNKQIFRTLINSTAIIQSLKTTIVGHFLFFLFFFLGSGRWNDKDIEAEN